MISMTDLVEKLEWLRDDVAKPLNDYVDEHGTRTDLINGINKYAPEPYQDPLTELVRTIDGLISEAAGERDSGEANA